MKLRWSFPAQQDVEAIGDYIANEHSSAAATRVMAIIYERTKNLATFSHKGRPGRVPDTRELVITGIPFIVVYRVNNDYIEILAVYHSSRKWPESF